jgi:hypothetical protein
MINRSHIAVNTFAADKIRGFYLETAVTTVVNGSSTTYSRDVIQLLKLFVLRQEFNAHITG